MNDLVKIGDAARRLGVSSITLRRLEREGAIPLARRHPRTRARYWLESELGDIREVVEPRLRLRGRNGGEATTSTPQTVKPEPTTAQRGGKNQLDTAERRRKEPKYELS